MKLSIILPIFWIDLIMILLKLFVDKQPILVLLVILSLKHIKKALVCIFNSGESDIP